MIIIEALCDNWKERSMPNLKPILSGRISGDEAKNELPTMLLG